MYSIVSDLFIYFVGIFISDRHSVRCGVVVMVMVSANAKRPEHLLNRNVHRKQPELTQNA